jgi:hypothetical protein
MLAYSAILGCLGVRLCFIGAGFEIDYILGMVDRPEGSEMRLFCLSCFSSNIFHHTARWTVKILISGAIRQLEFVV